MTKNFDFKNYPWKKEIDYRKYPDQYKIGKGEQGVLICEPYRNEILPYWKFKTAEIAEKSSQIILSFFYNYIKNDDLIGADLARKFLQMGFTRSRRYANYKGGKKYINKTKDLYLKGSGEAEKNKSAAIFLKSWQESENYLPYKTWKINWKKTKG